MNYAKPVVRSVRLSVRNPFAILLVSLATSVSVIPFITGLLIAGPYGAIVGLWTTSIMLGFVAVGGARIATVTLEREVSLGIDYFWEGIRNGRRIAVAVGVSIFVGGLLAFLAIGNPFEGIFGLCVLLMGIYILLSGVTLLTYSMAFWAASRDYNDIRGPLASGLTLLLEDPKSACWLIVQIVGWTLISIPFVIAPILILPGFLQLLGLAIVRTAAQNSSSHSRAKLSL